MSGDRGVRGHRSSSFPTSVAGAAMIARWAAALGATRDWSSAKRSSSASSTRWIARARARGRSSRSPARPAWARRACSPPRARPRRREDCASCPLVARSSSGRSPSAPCECCSRSHCAARPPRHAHGCWPASRLPPRSRSAWTRPPGPWSRPRPRCSTRCTGSSPTSATARRSCSSSTTSSGPTRCRCARWPSSATASTRCRCSCSSGSATVSPARTRPRWPRCARAPSR